MKDVAIMSQSSNADQPKVTGPRSPSLLPLPGPAVVIDVRKTTPYDPPLAWHLTAELEDLTTQMRLHRVKRWRFLSECIAFLTLDPLPPNRTVDTAPHFTLTRATGEIQSFENKDELITFLHKEYVDLVRTNRISAARDTHQSIASSRLPEVELELSTVRVFFLADPDSLTAAADYAALLRKKGDEYSNALHSGRDERISPILIYMNADSRQSDIQHSPGRAASPPPVVVVQDEGDVFPAYQPATQYDDLLSPPLLTMFDKVIPLHAYRDDGGFVGSEAQIYELELILYTLLLVPESLAPLSQDMRDEYADQYLVHSDLDEAPPSPPHSEVCMLGIASLECSVNWARRWLDYGLVKKLLQTIRETETLEDERNLRLPDGRDWLESWWADVRSVLPRTLVSVIPDAKGLAEFQRSIKALSFNGAPLRNSPDVLEGHCQNLGRYYTGNQGATLQQASQSGEQVMPLLKEASRKAPKASSEQAPTNKEQLKDLQELQRRANLFSVSLFKGTAGALPRAISQLSELENRIEEGDIGQYAYHTPNFSRQHEHFQEQARKAQHRLASLLNIWQLPFIGSVLRSTVLSLFLVAFIALCLWFLQDSLRFLPVALTYSVPIPAGISLFRSSVLIALGLAEFLYLFTRDKRLREQRDRILQTLSRTAIAHLTDVQLSIAANVALRLVQEAGLYQPKGKASQYKQRLRALDKVLNDAQEKASLHQRAAFDRLKLGLSPIQTGTLSTSTWLNLNTRKDLLPWEQTIETNQRLGKELIQNNPHLDMLAESLLRQLAMEKHYATSTFMAPQDKQSSTVQEQLLAISSELVATLLVAEVVGSSILTLHPLLERYMSLEQRDQYTPSLLRESIADLYNLVRAMRLEQAMNSDMGISSQQESFESFTSKAKKPVEQMLVAWVENLRETDDQSRKLLGSGNIIARLQNFQVNISDALDDLQKRCKLLGYHDELINSKDTYMLLMPNINSTELQEAQAALQSNQVRLLAFPDEEKLIYLHTYRVGIKS